MILLLSDTRWLLIIIRRRRSRSAAACSHQTFPWTICRSVRLSVCLPSALWINGVSHRDAVWHRRSDGSRNEAGGGVWRSVHGKGYFWGRNWGAPWSTGTYWTYVCYSAATRPSCQTTLGRLVSLLLLRVLFIINIIIITATGHAVGCPTASHT